MIEKLINKLIKISLILFISSITLSIAAIIISLHIIKLLS
jgi:hypothetical protein